MRARNILARNLRQARRQLGLSQEELALRAQVDRTYISALERAVYSASLDTIEKISDALGKETYELLYPTDNW